MLMRAVQVAEAWADGEEPRSLGGLSGFYVTDRRAWRAAERTARFAKGWEESAQKLQAIAYQIKTLYCIFGNPFCPVSILPTVLTWNDAAVVRLAQAAYDERHLPSGTLDNGRLAVLADALEEAGCTDADILGHLRGPGPHVRGCWAVDLCLDKS
jgi:hypothetical protein